MLFIRNWWILIVRGLTSIVFGLYFFAYPDLTVFLLVQGFLFYSAIDGVLSLLTGLSPLKNGSWRGVFLIMGGLAIAAALLTLYQPLMVSALLLTAIAPFVIFTGIVEIAAGQIFKRELRGTRWLTMGGAVSMVLGISLLLQPLFAFRAFEILLGTCQIVRGMVNVILALGLKLNREKIEEIMNPGH